MPQTVISVSFIPPLESSFWFCFVICFEISTYNSPILYHMCIQLASFVLFCVWFTTNRVSFLHNHILQSIQRLLKFPQFGQHRLLLPCFEVRTMRYIEGLCLFNLLQCGTVPDAVLDFSRPWCLQGWQATYFVQCSLTWFFFSDITSWLEGFSACSSKTFFKKDAGILLLHPVTWLSISVYSSLWY